MRFDSLRLRDTIFILSQRKTFRRIPPHLTLRFQMGYPARWMKLAVLFGGVSSEHTISCLSAASVLRNLDTTRYDIYVVGITQQGQWFYYPAYDPERIENGTWAQEATLIPAVLSPARDTHGLLLLHENAAPEAIRLDCVFPVLHGAGGEDGTIQGLLELAGIPYVGCGVAASANAMDKSITKRLVELTGVRQARYYLAHKHAFTRDAKAVVNAAIETIATFPMFVKPCSQGSSVGVSKATNAATLLAGLQQAFAFDTKVLVEEFIDGHEIECAVLGNREPIASTVGEIAPAQEFYTFDAKYHDTASQLYIPARLTPAQIETVRDNAIRVYTALGCTGLSRVDFFCTYAEGKIVFNEVNPIPGFTSISMYPKLFIHGGMSYAALLDRLIELANE